MIEAILAASKSKDAARAQDIDTVENPSRKQCSQIKPMRVYSNARYIPEAGDVVGYELALDPRATPGVGGKLYVYEGTPNLDGIPISGTLMDKRLQLSGEWIEHRIEYPSKKEIVETHAVKIDGGIGPTSFRGSLKIGDDAQDKIALKRVTHVWLCKP